MSSRSNTARRVVTGVDAVGKSYVGQDREVHDSATLDRSEYGRIARLIWATEEVPIPLEEKHDPVVNWLKDHPWVPEVGVHFDLFTWQPGSGFSMHATETIDIGVIISGEIELILEKESTLLGPGDCFVQRGTMHGWKVVGDKACTFVIVLIAKKKEEDE